jgi:hypothetical protein
VALGARCRPGGAGGAANALSQPQAGSERLCADHRAPEGLAAELAPALGGYTFKRPELLVQALTHVSVLGAPSYQRLELLGDSVLDVLITLRLLRMRRDNGRCAW